MNDTKNLPAREPRGTFVQTERAAHEAWAKFLGLKGSVAAMRVMHLLMARMGENNAAIVSQGTLATMLDCDVRTIRRAVAMLKEHNWVEVVQIGDRGGVNAYVINSRVAWYGKREGLRHALFTATVMASEAEQPHREELGTLPALNRVPDLFPGERQLPTGPGLPPTSQPSFPSMEPDLPARMRKDDEDTP